MVICGPDWSSPSHRRRSIFNTYVPEWPTVASFAACSRKDICDICDATQQQQICEHATQVVRDHYHARVRFVAGAGAHLCSLRSSGPLSLQLLEAPSKARPSFAPCWEHAFFSCPVHQHLCRRLAVSHKGNNADLSLANHISSGITSAGPIHLQYYLSGETARLEFEFFAELQRVRAIELRRAKY